MWLRREPDQTPIGFPTYVLLALSVLRRLNGKQAERPLNSLSRSRSLNWWIYIGTVQKFGCGPAVFLARAVLRRAAPSQSERSDRTEERRQLKGPPPA
jgi:hypothetical protein